MGWDMQAGVLVATDAIGSLSRSNVSYWSCARPKLTSSAHPIIAYAFGSSLSFMCVLYHNPGLAEAVYKNRLVSPLAAVDTREAVER